MKCYILDDTLSIKIISNYIANHKELSIVGTSSNTLIAYSQILNLKPDIVFINSALPKLNIEKLDSLISIIYTADAPHFAVQAFENNAIDYLMKPFTLERFVKSIDKARQKQVDKLLKEKNSDDDYFFVRNDTRGKVIRIKYDDITYIEASSNYVVIHMGSKNHLIYLTMKEIEDFLPPDKFIRVHKSYLVNEQKITSIDGNKIGLEDMFTIMLGVSYKEDFYKRLQPKFITSKRRPLKESPEGEESIRLNILN
jgi:DNA-binding LytR/AlgR family response regulator